MTSAEQQRSGRADERLDDDVDVDETELGIEQPDSDVQEQLQPMDVESDVPRWRGRRLPPDADEGDAAEQLQELPEDEEYE